MGVFKQIDIMLHNGLGDEAIAKWIRANAFDTSISEDESMIMAATWRHEWEALRESHYRGFKS